MKKLIIILLLLPFALNSQISKDKYYHICAGLGISATSHLTLKGEDVNPFKGTILTAPVAAGKEIFDVFNGGRFSNTDFAFTMASAVIVDLGVLGYKKIFRKKRKRIIEIEPYNPPLVKKNN